MGVIRGQRRRVYVRPAGTPSGRFATIMAKRAILLPTVVAAVLILAAAPAPSVRRPGGPAAVTVEPTLALMLDLSFEGVERARNGSAGRLRLDVGVVDDVDD